MITKYELIFALAVIVLLVAMWVYGSLTDCADDMPLLDLLRDVPEDEEIEKELWDE